MNLVYGEIVKVFRDDDVDMGTVCVGGALKNVALTLLPGVCIGDRVLVCDGVAISRVDDENQMETNNVSGNSR